MFGIKMQSELRNENNCNTIFGRHFIFPSPFKWFGEL